MKQKHQKTLGLIFHRPVSGGIKWVDIEKMFIALGAEVSEQGAISGTPFTFTVYKKVIREHFSPLNFR